MNKCMPRRQVLIGAAAFGLVSANTLIAMGHPGTAKTSLSFSIDGPFRDAMPIQVEQFEADFVQADLLRIVRRTSEDNTYARVMVCFMFKGAEDSRRRIRLTVELVSAKLVIGRAEAMCSDGRIFAKKNKNSRRSFALVNSETLKVSVSRKVIEHIDRMDITFALV